MAGVYDFTLEQGASLRFATVWYQPVPGITLANQGVWDSVTAYAKGDVVSYLGVGYYASGAVAAGTIPPAAPWTALTPYDLTGATARCQIRIKAGTPDPALAAIDEIGTTDGQITLGTGGDLTTGRIEVFFNDVATNRLIARSMHYDVFVKLASGDVKRPLKGTMSNDRAVTEPTHV